MAILDIIKEFAANTDLTNKYTGNLANPVSGSLEDVVGRVFQVVIGIVGLIAIVMLVIGGIFYTTSAGDANKVKKAKDTILYGIIGLVISLLAFAIVTFVIGSL